MNLSDCKRSGLKTKKKWKTTIPSDKPRMVCGRVKCEYKPRPTGKSSEPNSKSDENKTDK